MTLSVRGRALIGCALGVLVLGLAAWGWSRTHADPNGWTKVARADLVLGVEVTGTLKALDSATIGPPQAPDTWEYKISFMAPEGARVKKGQNVLGFDVSALQQQLREKSNSRDAAREEIENKLANLELAREGDDLRLAVAEANLRKTRLKLDRPNELVTGKDVAKARLDLELFEKEVAHVTRRLVTSQAAANAEIAALRDTERRATLRVTEIEGGIERMTVTSPREGTVTYVSNWREEKKKVGDTCWRSERVLEIPDLRTMVAHGEVDEAEAGKVAAGQRVSLLLDAHPDNEYLGKVTAVTRAVERKAAQSQLKVVRLEITLARTDPERMRPGMRFRGTVEIGRVAGALVVPLEAVSLTSSGAAVVRAGLLGRRVVPVGLGRRNDTLIEILSGVAEGDRVARRFIAEAR